MKKAVLWLLKTMLSFICLADEGCFPLALDI